MLLFKRFRNAEYELLFQPDSGLEILRGINGHDDPFTLEFPSLLDIGIMGTCEHICKLCYQGHENKPNMTLENFKLIIDQSKYHVNQVALGGRGDPNKHENFREIIEYCRKNGVVPNYTTSGMNIADEEIEISKLCGAVAVSDYQSSYTYKAINKLIDAGIKTNIHYIFSRESYYRSLDMVNGIDVWSAKFDISKLNAVIFLLFKPQGAGKHSRELVPNKFMLETFGKAVFNSKCKFKVGMDSCLVNHVVNHVKLTDIQRMSIDTCEGGRMSAYITPDMKFMPCSFSDKNIWACEIGERSLKDIWDNEESFNMFRNILERKSNCCPLGL